MAASDIRPAAADEPSITIDPSPSASASGAPTENANRASKESKPRLSANNRQTETVNENALLSFTKPKENVGRNKRRRHRAALACVRCRARKVRCNAVESVPCLNCKGDRVECILHVSRAWNSSRNFCVIRSGEEAQAQVKLDVPSSTSMYTSVPGSGFDAGLSAQVATSATTETRACHQMPNSFAEASQLGINDAISSCSLEPLGLINSTVQLPAFLKPFPTPISQIDVSYLSNKGALTLPPIPLQNALLRSYVDYVHPYMPLLELYDFLAVVNTRNPLYGQVSLLLYQAVMFAATAFVDLDSLREAGYSTRRTARKNFFQRTELLYDFEYETDRLVLIQSLLLMTYWQKAPEDHKDMWHWLGIAISLAKSMGLQHRPAAMELSAGQEKLRKRIWWCCVIRDRLIALGTRQSLRIKDEDFDVPVLQESDFDLEFLSEDNSTIPSDFIFLRDVSTQHEQVALCVSMAQLCIHIGHMLMTQYSPQLRKSEHGQNMVESTVKLLPRRTNEFRSVASVDTGLLSWKTSLSPTCQSRPLTPLDIAHGRKTVAVHRTLLHMLYNTTMTALHRPQLLPASSIHAPTASARLQELSHRRVHDAALQVSRMAAELHELGLDKYLPTTGVTVMMFAMVINLVEMKKSAELFLSRSWRHFCNCGRVVEKLQEMYEGADLAVGFLNEALTKIFPDINWTPEGRIESLSIPPEQVIHTQLWLQASKNETQYTIAPSLQDGLLPLTSSSALDTCTSNPKEGWNPPIEVLESGDDVSGQLSPLELQFNQSDLMGWSVVMGTKVDADQWLHLWDAFNNLNGG